MDWTALTIERNREALLRVVAGLLDLAALADGGRVARHVRNRAWRILRPAETALRRLIVIAAREFSEIAFPAGVFMYGLDPNASRRARRATAGQAGDGQAGPVPPFALADPVKRFSFDPPKRRPKGFPRICVIGLSEPTPIPQYWVPTPDDAVDATGLLRRLAALQAALGDIDGQARRLARWQARRNKASLAPASEAQLKGAGGKPRSPIRVGPPPGRRKRRIHEVDDILADCHRLAMHALSPDTG